MPAGAGKPPPPFPIAFDAARLHFALDGVTTSSHILLIASMIFLGVSSAQVSSTAPAHYTASTPISVAGKFARLDLSHNRPEEIRRELSDTNTIHLIARSLGLSSADLATVQIVPDPEHNAIELYQIGRAEKAFRLLGERLRSYVRAREEGHTKSFLFAALTNTVPPLSVADTDLRVLLLNQPLTPASWVKKADSGTRTNRAGQVAGVSTTTTIVNGRMQTTSVTNLPKFDEVCRWVSYKATDGNVEWRYVLQYKVNGRLDYIESTRRDAKEDDPKFRNAIQEVENEVEAEMKKQGAFGKFRSVHEFWHLKKDKLKARGIEWYSPAELNPNTNYD